MKKNEQLFDIMNDIPDEYVEDAKNDNAISEKRISVKRMAGTIAACAAAFAAIAAVPVLMVYINGRIGQGDDQLPVTTDTVTEITEISTEEVSDDHTEETSDDHTEDQDKANENLKDGQLSFGTGPKRPENYKPEKTYSCAGVSDFSSDSGFGRNDSFSSSRRESEESYPDSRNVSGDPIYDFLKAVLVNESYADEIVSDYKSETEKYIESLGLNEDDCNLYYGIVSSGNDEYGINGYIQIYAYLKLSDDTKYLSFIYDLIEEKRINNNSDLFYYGEDYIDQMMTAIYGENYDPEYPKPVGITLNRLLYDENSNYPYVMKNSIADPLPDWIYDISVIGQYRGLTGTIKTKYISVGSYDEWYTYCNDVHVDDYTILSECEKSRFSSEIRESNSNRKEWYPKILDFLKNNHYLDECTDKLLRMDFYHNDYYYDNYTFVTVYDSKGEYLISGLKFDHETEEILPVDKNIPEWRNYIKGCYNDGNHKQLVKETDFDPENCDCMCCQEVDWYDSEETAKKKVYPDRGNYVIISDEEVENSDDVAIVLVIYDNETHERHEVLVVMPSEKVSDPYQLTSHIGESRWDK